MSGNPDRRGRFITLEGGEGAGKSTHARLLADHLKARGLSVLLTREPGGAPGAEEIRRLLVSGEPGRWTPMTEALLHSAARAEHVARLIAPALAEGRWVVCDRFADSTMAYQGYGHGLGCETVAALNALVTRSCCPDLTLILDLPVADGLARARAREGDNSAGEDRYERMNHDFHERLREGYLEIARAEPGRCVVIDARDTVEAVQAAIRAAAAERLDVS
ncbi:MAG TPA: dTMP kinase [Alphaproteobacteria bacterium]